MEEVKKISLDDFLLKETIGTGFLIQKKNNYNIKIYYPIYNLIIIQVLLVVWEYQSIKRQIRFMQ